MSLPTSVVHVVSKFDVQDDRFGSQFHHFLCLTRRHRFQLPRLRLRCHRHGIDRQRMVCHRHCWAPQVFESKFGLDEEIISSDFGSSIRVFYKQSKADVPENHYKHYKHPLDDANHL